MLLQRFNILSMEDSVFSRSSYIKFVMGGPFALLVSFLSAALLFHHILTRHQKKFPPGPKGLPWIGSPWSMPKVKEWTTYGIWKKSYGPIVGVKVFGQPIVILNTARAAHELLSNRKGIYSERPSFPMLEMYFPNS